MTNTKPVFHGSDIEKISEYYHIDQNSITNFAGNVNPLGLSPSVKEAVAAHVDLFSSYPDRDYKSLRNQLLSTAMSLLISSCRATVQAN